MAGSTWCSSRSLKKRLSSVTRNPSPWWRRMTGSHRGPGQEFGTPLVGELVAAYLLPDIQHFLPIQLRVHGADVRGEFDPGVRLIRVSGDRQSLWGSESLSSSQLSCSSSGTYASTGTILRSLNVMAPIVWQCQSAIDGSEAPARTAMTRNSSSRNAHRRPTRLSCPDDMRRSGSSLRSSLAFRMRRLLLGGDCCYLL